jgi:hypothetical protein
MKKVQQGITLIFFLLIVSALNAQVNYRSVSNNVVIAGTSTLHDWEMKSAVASVAAAFELDPDGKLVDIVGVNFVMDPTSLKSGKGAMDDNAYKALKTKTYKTIKFASVGGTITPAGPNKYNIKCSGMMQIASKSVNTELTVSCTVNADGTITCTGSKSIKMTAFDVEPPSFMMGTIKTGDDLKITFTSVLKK